MKGIYFVTDVVQQTFTSLHVQDVIHQKLVGECTSRCTQTEFDQENRSFDENRLDNASSNHFIQNPYKIDRDRKLKPIIAFHTRLENYNKIRNRIFNATIDKKTNRSAKRMRKYWSGIKRKQKDIIDTIFEKENDLRPYAEVILFNEIVNGLLDTGAAISCIGGSLAGSFLDSGKFFKPIDTKVSTADGNPQHVAQWGLLQK